MNQTPIRSAFSYLAWGYLLLFFHINIGPVPLIPNCIAYLIIVHGITLLREDDRDLYLLRPFGFTLAALALIDLFSPLQQSLQSGASYWLTLTQSVLYLYFHFSLLTAAARIATRHQSEGQRLDHRLRIYRCLFVILETVLNAVQFLWFSNVIVATVLAVLLLLTALCTAVTLFQVRALFPAETDSWDTDSQGQDA